MKNNRQKEVGSLKTKIPTNTVPTAPIPVHTAYAVPKGKVCVALVSKYILIKVHITKPAYHKYKAVPVVSLVFPKQKVKATSNSPATINTIQFINSKNNTSDCRQRYKHLPIEEKYNQF